jgi:hypothetical protein
LGYFSDIESGAVMTQTFDFLFSQLDPKSHKILGTTAVNFFERHFRTLFAELGEHIMLAVWTLLFAFGSGGMRGTCVDSEDFPVSQSFP